ncbi:hypothetical protein L207DRAFT_565224 [Hyaloscypha variabilis F]|uniref:DNA-directed RNA polymerase III RPC4 n=1 Tax=Hyaloscypha variabilis (strain UAMH 11265 / GT02V1 / F) TaxID=1149755 RepID=A0A2J6RS16_HYAVF|nr:hypothetical protein L207DRAFT_565224 [Hyaloscypha variabilis F]
MPPKGARGAGRGRGRGRGKASAPPPGEQPPPSQPSTHDSMDIDSQSTVAPSSPLEAPVPKITTPQSDFLNDADPSPNSSPATVWTETPAPTPIRPSALRPEPPPILPPTRGGVASRGARVKATESRFKPKNIRRDARELEDLRKKEQARLAAIAAEEAGRAAWKARAGMGRGWGMRGRGDAMGRGAGRGRSGTASGVFGVMPEAIQKNPEFLAPKASGAGGGSRSGGSGSTGPKTVKGGITVSHGDYTSSSSTKGQNKDFLPDPQYPDEDLDAPRVDIELINLVSDESDDDPIFIGSRKVPKPKGKSSNKGGLKPVRLHREEHKERVTLVNTEPAIKVQSDSDEELPTIDEQRSSRAETREKKFKGTFEDIETVKAQIKTEPGLELTYNGIRPPVAASPESDRQIKERTSSPESKRKSKDHLANSEIGIDGPQDDVAAKAKRDRKARTTASKKKDVKPVIQTEEDRAEYERHLEDVAILANELGGLQGNLGAQSQDDDGDVAMDGPNQSPDKKEGRLYLFQFPPVLPELYNPKDPKPKAKAEIRAEKEKEKAEAEAQMSGISAKAKGKMKESGDRTGETVIKVEEEVLGADGKPKKEEEKRKRDEVVHEEGWIGKLVVRESGKVELCWGGTNLLVGRGVDAGFLTTGVMIDMVERGPIGGGSPEGKALSMGQVMGKFVVTPDWEKMV